MVRPNPKVRADILAHLRQTRPSLCRRWFEDIEALDLSGGTLRLLVREPLQLRYLRKHCQGVFTEAAQAVLGMLVVVRFVGLDEAGRAQGQLNGSSSPPPQTTKSWDAEEEVVLTPDYSFETFVVGPSNRLAHAGAIAVAARPGEAYNPFFVHGGVGLGKTHLLHAICQEVLRRDPRFTIHYTSCHDFIASFHQAVEAGQMSGFRHRFRNVGALVVDDIHELSHAETTQEEFFHTFNALSQAGKQVVLSCDAAPTRIPALEERLTSRFKGGLVAEIQRPGYETRMSIVRAKAAVRGIQLPDDAAAFIAARCDSNIRELEGAITSVQAQAVALKLPIDLALARDVLGPEASPANGRRPTIQEIADAVVDYYGTRLADILGKRRRQSIVLPRQVCMWLARRYTQHSLQEIGGYFGGRDHTTVIHAVEKIDGCRRADPQISHDLEVLEQRVRSLPARLTTI
jgi:chromosomal replication initiator protein